MTQRFNFTQDTPHGMAEVEMRRLSETHYEATVLLPTGSELEVSTETSSFEAALQVISEACDYWAADSDNNEIPDLSDPTPF